MLNKISAFAALLMALCCLSCQQDEIDINALNGTWVESVERSDTLIFNKDETFFTLNRGKEERNGHLLPKYGSGIYEYSLQDDVISVRNTLSSFSGFYDTFIKVEKSRLNIGDFYQKDTTNQHPLTFEKIP